MKNIPRVLLVVIPLLMMVSVALPQGSDYPVHFTFSVGTNVGVITVVAPYGYYVENEERHIIAHPGGDDALRIDVYRRATHNADAIAASSGEGLEINTLRLETGVPWRVAVTDDTIYAALGTLSATYVLVGTVRDPDRLEDYMNTTFTVFLLTFNESDRGDYDGLRAAQPILDAMPPIELPPHNGIRILDFAPFESELEDFEANRLADVHEIAFEATIQDIQLAFEAGDLTSVELTLYYLSRIRRYDAEHLHSVLELNPEALDIAQMLDDERTAGNVRSPMHGISVLLTDNIGTGDLMHVTFGAVALMDARSDRDAFLVTKLREGGAIVLGKANLSEWEGFVSYDMPDGYSALGGQVLNPYGDSLEVRGSSIGAAVSVSANLVTTAIGTGIPQSINGSSEGNSVVGMYPSIGLISKDRIISLNDFGVSAGPIAKNVQDLATILTQLAGTDESDPYRDDAASLTGTDFTSYLDKDALQNKRIVVVFGTQVDWRTYVRSYLTQQVVDTLTEAGAELIFVSGASIEAYGIISSASGVDTAVNAYLSETKAPFKSLEEIVELNERNPSRHIPYGQRVLYGIVHYNRTPYPVDYLQARDDLRRLLNENDADMFVSAGIGLTSLAGAAGFPAITVPAGYRGTGIPFGITFVGDYLSDGELIGYAYAFEQASMSRVPPPIGND